MIQTKCGLVQSDAFINTTICTLEMCGHFKCVCEGIDYVHSRPQDVLVHDRNLRFQCNGNLMAQMG